MLVSLGESLAAAWRLLVDPQGVRARGGLLARGLAIPNILRLGCHHKDYIVLRFTPGILGSSGCQTSKIIIHFLLFCAWLAKLAMFPYKALSCNIMP